MICFPFIFNFKCNAYLNYGIPIAFSAANWLITTKERKKSILTIPQFSHAATTLTSWHLLVTFCSLHVALYLKLFEHKPFDPRTVIGFGILNGTSIGLLNLSLGFNSVGFYQVTL